MGIAGHIEQADRGATRKSPQAHKPLLPASTRSNGFFYHTGLYLFKFKFKSPRHLEIPQQVNAPHQQAN
jgi:hypothetical protein